MKEGLDFFAGNGWTRIVSGLMGGFRLNVAIEGVPPGEEGEIVRRLGLCLDDVGVLHCSLAELLAAGADDFSERLQERIVSLLEVGREAGGQPMSHGMEDLGLGPLSWFKFKLPRLCAQRGDYPVLVLSGYDSLLALDARQRAEVTGGPLFEIVEDAERAYRFSVLFISAVPVNWVEFDTPPYSSAVYQRVTSYRYSKVDDAMREHVLERMPEVDRDRMQAWLQSPLGRLS